MVDNPDYLISDEEELSSDIQQELENRQGELYLKFYLPSGEEFALPATGISEVMQQEPDRITPIPNASTLLLGTINLRGRIIWVADLGQFLDDSVVLNTQQQEITVIAVEDGEIILGLAIDGLGDMQWLDVEKLKKFPTNLCDPIAPYVKGEWILNEEENQYLRLLDHKAILNSARWNSIK